VPLLTRWLSDPRVYEFYMSADDPRSEDDVRHEFLAEDFVQRFIVQRNGEPIGYLQFYRWRAWPEAAETLGAGTDEGAFGIDLFIGEPSVIGRGVGTRVVSLACAYLEREHGASAVVLATETTNHRAQRAYEKAGFAKVRRVLDTDTRGGERVWCWLMVRRTIRT